MTVRKGEYYMTVDGVVRIEHGKLKQTRTGATVRVRRAYAAHVGDVVPAGSRFEVRLRSEEVIFAEDLKEYLPTKKERGCDRSPAQEALLAVRLEAEAIRDAKLWDHPEWRARVAAWERQNG